jgi:hypothetical protein
VLEPPIALPSSLLLPMPIALVAALVRSEAVSLTVLTMRLIALRALESAPPFFEPPPRFFGEAFFAGAFFAAAFFAGAFFEAADAFFDDAFFAGAFFAAFFEDAFFEDEAFFDDAFLLAPFFEEDFFADDFFDADFFEDDFFAGAFFADFFEDFLAAMDSLLFKTWSVGSRTFERKLCCVATALHEFQCRRRCGDCHARNAFRDGLQRLQSPHSPSPKRLPSTSSSSTGGSRASW